MEKLTNQILLIDDNPDNLSILADLIQHAFPGYGILTAGSGIKGLALATSADPDVIMLDVVMPGMNGFEVCQKLKSDPRTSLIPVIFLTSIRGDKLARVQAIEVGAEAFLSRPVDESELIAQIRAMQKIKKAASRVQDEKENLTSLVTVQTQALQQTHSATLNLLEDLHAENEARKKNEAALRLSEATLQQAQRVAHVGSWTWHIQSNLMEGSDEMYHILGLQKEHFSGDLNEALFRAIHPDDRLKVEQSNRLISQNQPPVPMEFRVVWPDGSVREVRGLAGELTLDESGNPETLTGIVQDITERKHAQALQNAVYQIAAAADATSSLDQLYPQIHLSISAVMPADNFYIALYDAARDLLRFPYFKDIKDGPVGGEFHPGKSLSAYILRSGKSMLVNQTERSELVRQGKVQEQGTPCAIWLGVPLIIEGKAIGVMAVQHYSDPHAYGERELHILEFVSTQVANAISRKQAEQALLESELKYRTLVEKANEGIVIAQAGTLVFANRRIYELLGVPDGELEGKTLSDYVWPEDREMVNAAYLKRVSGKADARPYDFRIIGVAGQPIWVYMSATVIQWNGKPATLNLLTDISERKQAEEALRESEGRFRTLFEKAPVAICISRNGIGLFANQKDLQMFGLSSLDEVIGRPVTDFLAPQSVEASLERTQRRALGLPTPGNIETTAMCPDGSQFQAEVVIDSVQLSDGPANLSFITDITERKQAEDLQQAVYQITAAAETAASLDDLYPKIHQSISSVMAAEDFYIALYDEAHNLLRFPYFKNPRDESFVDGIQPGRGTTAYVLRTGKSLLCTRERHAELERQGEVILLGVPSAIWLGVPLCVEGKTIGAMVVQHYSDPHAYGERELHMLEFVSSQVAIAIDRKQKEAALRESESRYRGLFEHSPISLWEEDFSEVKRHIEAIRQSGVTDFHAFFESHPQVLIECIGEIKVLDVNTATLVLMHAADKNQLIGNLQQVFGADASEGFVDEFVSIAEGHVEFAWVSVNYTLDGQKLTVSLRRSATPGFEDTLEKMLISVVDITASKQAEEALRESEERFHKAFEEGPIGMAMAGFAGGPFISVNAAFCRMLGYTEEELLRLSFVDITHPDHRGEDQQAVWDLRDGVIQIHNTEKHYLKKNGEAIWASRALTRIASADGQSFYALAMIEDITARKQAEDQIRQLNASLEERVVERTQQLRQAQEQLVRHEKLATLGQLAGGVGHELRNPLGVINSAVYYLKLVQPDADEKIKKYHLMIEQEVNTAGRIINDLLDFGRVVSPDRQAVAIPELLERVLTRFPPPASVRVQLKLPESLPKVFADPLHVEQVLGNLATNACQAMKDTPGGGRLTISVHKSRWPAGSSLPSGPCIKIAIQDTGTGITPENMHRLFEPLFTTKVRGIGLGLAVSKKLAEANGGRIEVSSVPGKGSTFTLSLPVKEA